jgi:hypothetical protein
MYVNGKLIPVETSEEWGEERLKESGAEGKFK